MKIAPTITFDGLRVFQVEPGTVITDPITGAQETEHG